MVAVIVMGCGVLRAGGRRSGVGRGAWVGDVQENHEGHLFGCQEKCLNSISVR